MSLIGVLLAVIRFYEILIFVYVVLSWFVAGKGGGLAELYRVLGTICEPYIGLFRRILPIGAVGGAGVDFSPLAAILVLQVVIFLLQVAF